METAVEIGLSALGAYLALGAVFAVALHAFGLERVDPATRGAGWLFRLLVTPGLVALWPLVALRWRRALSSGPTPGGVHTPVSAAGLRAFHRRLAYTLALLVPLLAGAGIFLRPGRTSVDPVVSQLLVEPFQLPEIVATHERPFDGLAIARLHVRGIETTRRQIELEIAEDLELPNLLLYWAEDEAAFPREAIYLGAAWGPGIRRYDVEPERMRRGGVLVLFSPTLRERAGLFRLTGE